MGRREWGRAGSASILKDSVLGVPKLFRLGGHSCLGGREKPTFGDGAKPPSSVRHPTSVCGGWRVLRLPAVGEPGTSLLRHLCL